MPEHGVQARQDRARPLRQIETAQHEQSDRKALIASHQRPSHRPVREWFRDRMHGCPYLSRGHLRILSARPFGPDKHPFVHRRIEGGYDARCILVLQESRNRDRPAITLRRAQLLSSETPRHVGCGRHRRSRSLRDSRNARSARAVARVAPRSPGACASLRAHCASRGRIRVRARDNACNAVAALFKVPRWAHESAQVQRPGYRATVELPTIGRRSATGNRSHCAAAEH